MIDQITISKIQDTAQIYEVVSDFVTLRKRGVNWVGLCPFHDDRNPSFYVSPAKNICKCFSCGEGGTPIHFIMKHENLNYFDALRYLAKKYNIEIEEKEYTDEERQAQSDRESMFILNEYARDYFVKMLHESQEGIAIGMSYFKERGFREDIIKKFQLGYSLEQRDAFSAEAQKMGYNRDYLLKTGLSTGGESGKPLIDRFRGRVMFPIHTLSGKVVGFGGRILKKVPNTGKYVNSPESEIYSKSRELYGLYFAKGAIVKQEKCFLVEGYTDVISMHQAGVENVVASSGTALTHGQIRLIHRFTENVTVLYDGDKAGINAALRGIDLLLEEGMNVKVVLLPDGEDPDSFAKKQNADSFARYIEENETDFIRFKTELLIEEVGDDPIKRAGMISSVVESISIIPNNIKRSVYIQESAQLLNIQERVLINEVNKIRKRNWEKKREQKDHETGVDLGGEVADEKPSSTEKEASGLNKSGDFDVYEREIIRYIVRYGNTPMYRKYETKRYGEGGQTKEMQILVDEGPGVTEFIQYDLERDEIKFKNSIYQHIFDEAVEHVGNDNFDSAQYFLNFPDQEISKVASELLSDKYHLSKIHSKMLGEEVGDKNSRLLEENHLMTIVPRATTELKNAYVTKKIEEVKEELKKGDSDDYLSLISRLKELQEIRRFLAKQLGERIILKY